jgi:hypothetical protein
MRTTVLVLVAFALSACAAMVRTWDLSAQPSYVESPVLRVAVSQAKVKQKDLYLTLRLRNLSKSSRRVHVGAVTMTLPDGERVVGKTSLVGRVRGALASLGLGRRSDEPLAADATVEVEVTFRQHRRDLRRHPRLTIDLSAVEVDGQPLATAPLVLVPPPRAPIGEQI